MIKLTPLFYGLALGSGLAWVQLLLQRLVAGELVLERTQVAKPLAAELELQAQV